MKNTFLILSLLLSLALNGLLLGKVLLSREEAERSHYAFRIVRAKTSIHLGMSKDEVIKLVGSEPDHMRREANGILFTWSTAYRVGPLTTLIYDPAPHGQYLHAHFDENERLIEVHLDET